jgi:hypothetical protein
MPRPRSLVLLAVAAWLLVASPLLTRQALALVEDPLGLLGANFDLALDTGIRNINAAKIDVVVLRTLPQDADGMARLHFNELHMTPDAGVVMAGTVTKNVGAYLGSDYTSRGVTPALVQRLVRRVYVPAAARDMPSEGLLALVRQIKLARTLGRDPDLVPPRQPLQVGLPWWWYVPPIISAALGLVVYVGMRRLRSLRRRARLRRLIDRLEDLQYQLKLQEPALAQLEGAAAEGNPSAVLIERDEALRAESASLAKATKRSGDEIKQGLWEDAERRLADAEARVFPLAVGLAGALGAHKVRLAGGNAKDALARADRCLARWHRLAEGRARWASTAHLGSKGPQQLGERLAALGRVLASAPLNLGEAEDFLDATEAIYSRSIDPASAVKLL